MVRSTLVLCLFSLPDWHAHINDPLSALPTCRDKGLSIQPHLHIYVSDCFEVNRGFRHAHRPLACFQHPLRGKRVCAQGT